MELQGDLVALVAIACDEQQTMKLLANRDSSTAVATVVAYSDNHRELRVVCGCSFGGAVGRINGMGGGGRGRETRRQEPSTRTRREHTHIHTRTHTRTHT